MKRLRNKYKMSVRKSLACALIKSGKIVTSMSRAKDAKPYIEKLITIAKQYNLTRVRQARSRLHNDAEALKKLFIVGELNRNRNGGYISTAKYNKNGKPMVLMQIIDFIKDTNVIVENNEDSSTDEILTEKTEVIE